VLTPQGSLALVLTQVLIAAKGCWYLVANKLWCARSMTEEEVKEKIDWPAVKERMERILVTQRRKCGELRGIMREWH
jgi:hypothetical protein